MPGCLGQFARPFEGVFGENDGDDLVEDGGGDDGSGDDGGKRGIDGVKCIDGDPREHERNARVGQQGEPEIAGDRPFRFGDFSAQVCAARFTDRARHNVDGSEQSRACDQAIVERHTEVDDHDNEGEIEYGSIPFQHLFRPFFAQKIDERCAERHADKQVIEGKRAVDKIVDEEPCCGGKAEPEKKERKTCDLLSDMLEKESEQGAERDSDDKRKKDDADYGQCGDGRAALRGAHDGNDGEEDDDADDVVDRRKRNERLCDGALRPVFVDDGKRGRRRRRKRDPAKDEGEPEGKTDDEKDDGKDERDERERPERLNEGDADDLSARFGDLFEDSQEL